MWPAMHPRIAGLMNLSQQLFVGLHERGLFPVQAEAEKEDGFVSYPLILIDRNHDISLTLTLSLPDDPEDEQGPAFYVELDFSPDPKVIALFEVGFRINLTSLQSMAEVIVHHKSGWDNSEQVLSLVFENFVSNFRAILDRAKNPLPQLGTGTTTPDFKTELAVDPNTATDIVEAMSELMREARDRA